MKPQTDSVTADYLVPVTYIPDAYNTYHDIWYLVARTAVKLQQHGAPLSLYRALMYQHSVLAGIYHAVPNVKTVWVFILLIYKHSPSTPDFSEPVL